MMREKNILRVLENLILQSTADQTETLLLTEDSSLARFTPTSIHQHVAEKNQTLFLRVVTGKRVAVVTTNVLQPSSLKDSLEKAITLARFLPPNEDFLSLPGPKPIPWAETHFENVHRLTPQRRGKVIRTIMSLVKEKGFKASGALSHGEVEVGIVNSLGVKAYQKYSDFFLHLIVQSEMGSGYASFISRDLDQLQVEPLVRGAMTKASRGAPQEVKPGEYDVILEPDAVHELLSFLGHLGFHGLAFQEGRSFFCNRLGERMVDEQVTIYDDGMDPEGLQVPFDFEGGPKQKVLFFEEGVARNVTHDSFTAGRAGVGSTGHARIPPNSEGPIPLNLFMRAGKTPLEEMVRTVRRGIYVTRFHYTNVVEPMKAVITGMTRDGTFRIEEGEIKSPIQNLRFTESILKALSRVKAVSAERKICSSGSVYGRRFMTGTVVPALRIDGFNFSGVSSL